ncbi:M4 family metallopeptidase [Neolewinella persica]|uniref:M4 family metallopeptidase n=1 Tax=Neolewinella persica TaxID=70998 RepID=UPI000372E22A|nr:M4 family metallopeptidase [Neolewinella persica]
MHRFSLLFFLLFCSLAAPGQSRSAAGDARAAIQRAGAEWRADGSDGYLSVQLTKPIRYAAGNSEATAEAFMQEFGAGLGLAVEDSINTSVLVHQRRGVNGGQYLRFAQHREGIPVLGGNFTVALDQEGDVTGFNGTLLSPTSFAPAPAPQSASDHHQQARQVLLDKYPHALQWDVTPGQLTWTSANPWQPGRDNPVFLTRAYEVTEPAGFRAERVYLRVTTGQLVLRHQLHCDLDRRLYHRNTAGFNSVWREGDAFPGDLAADDQELLVATEEFYNLFHRTFGRISYDDNNGQMRGVTNAFLNNCPNANAGGNVVRHCTGVVSDDIVGHEWTHNYIRSMNGLIYAFESGAINEGYADIFGECLDLLNNRGDDTNDQLPRTDCDDNNMRWLLAEDATAIDTALRDLWNPECKFDASSRDSPYFVCSTEQDDAGGVHTNSGLVNKTFALLADGGTVNGVTFPGIGLTKAMHIFHHANNNYITQVTDFFALGDMLVVSANDLLGVNLPALTLLSLPAMLSDSIIRPADIQQLELAISETQLRGEGPCPPSPTLAQGAPGNCASATVNAFGIILTQNWEDSLQDWSVVELPEVDSTWDAKPWTITESLPDGRPGLGVFAPNPRSGDCLDDLENGQVHLTSPTISLPVEETEFILSFDHYYVTQKGYDGGVLYLSRNNGNFVVVSMNAFLFNGYDDRLEDEFGNDNPLAGLRAFHGSDQNSTSGTWGTSIVDLNEAGVQPGDDIRLRWVMGHDGCDGRLGWYLDDIKIGYCGTSALPVTFLSFNASAAKTHIALAWQTADEEQNDGFYVERREVDAAAYRELGFVSAGRNQYSFDDHFAQPGVNYYYRLRQVDFDGSERYSDLVSARIAISGLQVFPNPVYGLLNVRSGHQEGNVIIYNAAGKKVMEAKLNEGAASLRTGSLSGGIYLLRVADAVVRVVVR